MIQMDEQAPAPKGSPKWMATFADMSTLLLTFFVLMLSFANIDIQAFHDMLGSVQNAFGVQTRERGEFQAALKEQMAGDSLKLDAQDVVEKMSQQNSEKMAEQIEKIIEENSLAEQAEIQVGQNSVRIRIKGQILFSAGEAWLKYDSFKFLDGIADAMNLYEFFLLVEGHTDSRNISTDRFPSNWELSGARAAAVVRYLIDKGIANDRLSGIGHASNYPIASNETQEGRMENRRVELIFTKKPFRSMLGQE